MNTLIEEEAKTKSAVMYSPCVNCPFRTDRPAFLSKAKARQIVATMRRDGHFDCHKTVDYSGDEPRSTKNSKICAGFAIMCESEGRATQMMRIAERIGLYDASKLDMDAPVHKNPYDFIEAQTR